MPLQFEESLSKGMTRPVPPLFTVPLAWGLLCSLVPILFCFGVTVHPLALNGHKECCAAMVARGADPFVLTVSGQTALKAALKAGHIDIANWFQEVTDERRKVQFMLGVFDDDEDEDTPPMRFCKHPDFDASLVRRIVEYV